MHLVNLVFSRRQNKENLPQDDERATAAFLGSFFIVDGNDARCLIEDASFDVSEDELEVSCTTKGTQKSKNFTFPYHAITNFRHHLSDCFQFTERKKSGNGTEYGIQVESEEAAAKFRSSLLEKLQECSVVVVETHGGFAEYDSNQRCFVEVSGRVTCSLVKRPRDEEHLLIVRRTDETTLLFQDVISRELQIWPVPQASQLTFWGTGGASARRMFLLEAKGEFGKDAEVTDFFNRLDEVLLASTGKEFITQNESERMADVDEDDQMFVVDQAKEDDEAPSDYDWESPAEEEESRPSRKDVCCKDPSRSLQNVGAVHKFMQVGKDRTFVCRGRDTSLSKTRGQLKRDQDALEMGIYGPGDLSPVVHKASIKKDKFKYHGSDLMPKTALLHDEERKLLMNDESQRESVFMMDLETEKVVQTWSTNGLAVQGLVPSFRGGEASTDPTFLCNNACNVFLMDTRLKDDARTSTITYTQNPNFTAAATDEAGHLLVGSRTGDLRLYDGEVNRDGNFKRAKTHLTTLQEPITAVDVTADGSWILATTKTYLVMFPTKLASSGQTGFVAALGKRKPPPVYLRIKKSDIMEYGLTDITFSPARFDKDETAVVTSTGSLAVIWDMKSIKRKKPRYTIKLADDYIKDARIREGGSVVVAYPQDIGVFSRRRQGRSSI